MALPLPTTPVYELNLPISGINVSYRPFLVKEEKILLIANETDSIEQANSAIRTAVDNCTFNKLDLSKLSLAEIEYIFVHIRSKSVGEDIDGSINCEQCDTKIKYVIDLNKVKIVQNEKTDKNIRIADDTVITMKYPSMASTNDLDGLSDIDVSLYVTASCVDRITIGEETFESDDMSKEEIAVYLENLTTQQLEKIGVFMETIPKVVYEDHVLCPSCGHNSRVFMEGMGNFFG